MASMTMQFGWVKSTFPVALKRTLHCEPLLLPCRIGLAARVSHVSCARTVSPSEKKVALRVSCCSKATESDAVVVVEKEEEEEETEKSYTCVMKFGGSSVANSERMREVANLILSFPEERPIIVLSAMGKTTNMLLLVLFFFFFSICLPLICFNIFMFFFFPCYILLPFAIMA